MPTPHKHAEFIKAWADGAEIESRPYSDSKWAACPCPAWSDTGEYRIKPAAPKWPQTTMTEDQLAGQVSYIIQPAPGQHAGPFYASLANAAIANACETGQVVPAATVDKMMLECTRIERELREALHKANMALATMPKGVESSLLDGMVERCLPAAKETLFYGLRVEEMNRDQLLVMAFKGWQLLQEARTPVDLVAFPKE